MTPLRLVLGSSRLVVGLFAWLAPDACARVFGIDPAHADRFISRLFGARDFTLAATLLAAPPAALAPVAAIGAAVDAVDTVAGLDEYRRGNLSKRALVLGPMGAATFAVLGVLVARDAAEQADGRP